MVIKGYRVGPLLKKTAREIGEDNVGTLSASAAYNFFFSLFPLLLFLAPLLTLLGDKRAIAAFLTSQLTSVLPREQATAFRPMLDKAVFARNASGIMSAGIVLAAWSGSNVLGTMMSALNTAYDVTETRSWVKRQVIRLVIFVVAVVIVLVSTIIFLRGPRIANSVGSIFGLGSLTILVWKLVQYPIAAAGLVGLAFMLLYVLPDVKQHKGYALAGALVTTALWIIANLFFRLYIAHFPPNKAYGLIGGVIILLTWMYYTMFVVLIGGELASELHHGTGAVAPDKGAIYVGRIVNGSGPGSPSVERS